MLRRQTALIAESFVGKGNGFQFVISNWPIEEGDNKEITRDELKELLKKKREHDALRKLKIDGKRN